MVELNAHRDQGIAGRSNVQHRTSNNDVARTAQALAPCVAPHVCFFIFSHSKFDVGRSMFVFSVFDAQNFCSLWEKAYRLSCLTLPAHDTVALILAFDHNCYSKNKAG